MDRIGQKEEAYIKEVLAGQFSSSNTYQMVTRLEQRFAEKFQVKHAIAMVNGTATLHMALEAAGIRPGDEVICPPLTMSSTAIAALHANAVPVFADVDKDTFLITADSIQRVMTKKRKQLLQFLFMAWLRRWRKLWNWQGGTICLSLRITQNAMGHIRTENWWGHLGIWLPTASRVRNILRQAKAEW